MLFFVVLLTLGCTTPIGLQGIVPRYFSLQEISARSAGRSGSAEGFLLADKSAKNKREASASTAGNEIVSAAAADASIKRRLSLFCLDWSLKYFSGIDTFLRGRCWSLWDVLPNSFRLFQVARLQRREKERSLGRLLRHHAIGLPIK